MIYEVWWPEPTEPYLVREYRCAGPSGYGQHHGLTECKEYRGPEMFHVCYMDSDSIENAMKTASGRHPSWVMPPVWLGSRWWEKLPSYRPQDDSEES